MCIMKKLYLNYNLEVINIITFLCTRINEISNTFRVVFIHLKTLNIVLFICFI